MATILKPPVSVPAKTKSLVFLCGSIDMGEADNWQDRLTTQLESFEVVFLNPRRDDWDASWKQSIENPQFREQVEWELKGLERADAILVYFTKGSKAPITLLELGLIAQRPKVLVFCASDFWRRSNVEVVCAHHEIPLHDDETLFLAAAKELLSAL